MRIAIVAPGLGPCGGARMIVEIADRLQARGHLVAIVGPGIQNGWIDIKTPILPFKMAVTANPYDVVMATGHQTVAPAIELPGLRKFYYVQMLEHMFYAENSGGWREAFFTYPAARNAGFQFITIATWQKEVLAAEWGIEAQVVSVAVNRDHFYPDGKKQDYILVEGDNRNHAKDVDGLGWQVAQAMREEYGLKLHGFAAYEHSHSGLFDRFIARPSERQMRQMESGALFLIKASKYEGRAGAVSESMVCGTTCARAITQGDEDVIDGYTGLRTPYELNALLTAARALASSPELRRRLERNCLKYTKTHLQWDATIDRLEELFSTSISAAEVGGVA